MPLSEALEKLEEILKTYPVEPSPAQPEVAKDCEICMERPREVRFACGHCVVCTECLGVIRAAAQTNARKAADESLHPKVREDAAKLTIARCPTCDEPIGEKLADSGAQLGTEPTFKLPASRPPARAPAQPGAGGRGGRGRGRGTGQVLQQPGGRPSTS